MENNRLKAALIILAIILFSSCKSSSEVDKKNGNSGSRQKGKPSTEQLMNEMNANKDSKLTETEVKGPLKNDFAKIDTDGDSFLSMEEFENAPKPEKQSGHGQGRFRG